MKTKTSPTCVLLLLLACACCAAPPTIELDRMLAFEGPHENNFPWGWKPDPEATIFVDDSVVHGGEWSARIERDEDSKAKFTALTLVLPVDFTGGLLELEGYLRTQSVTDRAGLWLGQENGSGMLQYESMRERGLNGTTNWNRYRIKTMLDPQARTLKLGVILFGEGKVWADDLRLRVNGQPVTEVARVEVEPTVLELDQEFDGGSGITATELSDAQIDSLVVLARVWGMLKYHHPRVTAGKLHWDYELFRILPQVLQAADPAARNAAILEWARHGAGVPERCGKCDKPVEEGAHLVPRIEWIHDGSMLGQELSAFLVDVHRNRFKGQAQFYIALNRGVRNADFANEPAYDELEQIDAGYRMLALFRFWNIIEYWFPYRDLIEEDWEGVLREFLPRLAAAENDDEYEMTLVQLIARARDGHANLWSSMETRPPAGECQLPVQLRFVEERAIVIGFADETDGSDSPLRVGDVILAFDGATVERRVEEWSPYYGASNRPARLRSIAGALTRGDCGELSLKIDRDGAERELTVERVASKELNLRWTHDRPGATFQLLSDDVAYVKLSSIEAKEVADYIRKARGTRGLVIDIRNYPSEFMVFELGQRLIATPTRFARFTKPSLENPGAFGWTKPLQLEPMKPRYEGRVVVLVDERSQSQAEYTAMALRAGPDAIVVGSTTAGADGNISPFMLPGGHRSMISGIGVFYPDKTPTQRVGIIPDVTVRPTIAGIRAGRDEVLEQAIRELLGAAASEEAVRRMAAPR